MDGQTLTSPSIYVSFTSIAAWENNRAGLAKMCGPQYTSQLISPEPEEISSVRYHRNGKYPHIGTAYPFKFADYQPHTLEEYTMSLISWPQYQGGSQCQSYATCTMIRDDYAPLLVIHRAVTQIDPRWTNCDRMMELPAATLVARGSQTAPTDLHSTGRHSIEKQTPTPHSPIVPPTPTITNGHGFV